jgi:glyoxylate/hydroxypyruvate reductase
LLAFTNKTHPPSVLYLSSRRRDNQDEIDADFSKSFDIDVRRAEKEEIAEKSDIVVVLCDLNPSTKDLVNREFLRRMKKTAVLVNAARVSRCPPFSAYPRMDKGRTNGSEYELTVQGPVVNSEDLAEALEQGEIFGAGLDVITGEPHISPDHPLVKAKNCKHSETFIAWNSL